MPPEVATQRDVAAYIIDLANAGADCRDNVVEVGKLVEGWEQKKGAAD